jgi:nucleolar protein 56
MDKKLFLEKTIKDLKVELESPDQRIIALYQIVDKLPKNINELFEQLRVVTDTIYPNLEKEINVKDYCKILLLEKVTIEELKKIGITNTKVIEIIDSGVSITLEEKEKKLIKNFAENILELIKIKEELENQAHTIAEKTYPTFCSVTGTKIACQMLVIAGSISRLSRMPSSTIQLLGAEKSLFKSIKMGNKKTPKYGLLFNHSLIINKTKKDKGRIARFLAGKIAIAIKADISGKDLRKELSEKISKKIKE